MEEGAQHNFELDKSCLEILIFLWHCLVDKAEPRWKAVVKEVAKKAVKVKAKKNSDDWDWCAHRTRSLEILERLVIVNLDRIFISSAERDVFVK